MAYESKRDRYIRLLEELLNDEIMRIIHQVQFTEGAAEEILELLKEQPEPEWIPCDERLPEDFENTLVTIKIPGREAKVRSGFYSGRTFCNDNGDCWNATDLEVLGWMPQPKPFCPKKNEPNISPPEKLISIRKLVENLENSR